MCPGPCPLDAMCLSHSHKFLSRITALTSQGALESLGTVTRSGPREGPSTIASDFGMGGVEPESSLLIQFPSIALHRFLPLFSFFTVCMYVCMYLFMSLCIYLFISFLFLSFLSVSLLFSSFNP